MEIKKDKKIKHIINVNAKSLKKDIKIVLKMHLLIGIGRNVLVVKVKFT